MIFGYITLLVAFVLSAAAAYYSVLGLTAIFASNPVPIIVMGTALEIGKVISAMWLHKNWQRSPWQYKTYLVPALIFLMLLTSMGTFGFLSKAHLDQAVPSGDAISAVATLDDRIRVQTDIIESSRKNLKQMADTVDQAMARTTDAKGVDRSAQLRKLQQKERAELQNTIQTAQNEITTLQEKREPLARQVRQIEAEVGPLKYIAALVYEDATSTDVLEKAVRWVIILIVSVFDPLAVVLILAGSKHLEWAREDKKAKPDQEPELVEEAPILTLSDNSDSVPFDFSKHPYLFFRDTESSIVPHPPMVYKPEQEVVTESVPTEVVVDATVEEVEPAVVEEVVEEKFNEVYVPREAYDLKKGESNHHVVRVKAKSSSIPADNEEPPVSPAKAHFGTQFPENPGKGEIFLKVDVAPSQLYKFNGKKWLTVDKTLTDSYVYNDEYLKHLVGQLERGELSPDDLSPVEQNQIREFLAK